MARSLFGLGRSSSNVNQDKSSPGWERDLVSQLALDTVKERRRARRWGVFFKLLFFGYLFALLILYWPDQIQAPGTAKEHTALVEVKGIITDGAKAQLFSGRRAENTVLRVRSSRYVAMGG